MSELNLNPGILTTSTSSMVHAPLLDIVEASPTKGELIVPAVEKVSVALATSNYSATWRCSRGMRSEVFSVGTLAICQFNRSRNFDMGGDAQFAVVMLKTDALEHIRRKSLQNLGDELQPQDLIQDPTLRHLMEVLLREKREGFQNGSFFLDSVASALISYLFRHYSTSPPFEQTSVGGMTPSTLRRCIEFMEARLEGDLRLSELAREANLSSSHFIRTFRQSTGKTPHQFLLQRRVERAQVLMRDHRRSLTEVALASGFADQHHLARVFRRITRVTPSSYRRTLS